MTCHELEAATAALALYEGETRTNPLADVSQGCAIALYEALRVTTTALEAGRHPEGKAPATKLLPIVSSAEYHPLPEWQRNQPVRYPALAALVNRDRLPDMIA